MSPRDRPSHAAMAAGAVAAGVASHLVLKRLMKTYRTKGLTKLSLLPSENTSLIRGSAATSTVTFFTGDYRLAATQLTARIEQIVAANPWLDSFLEDGSPLAAFYPAGKKIFSVRGDIELRRVSASTCFSEYDEMVHAVQAVLCKTTDESVGNREPVFKVTLIPAPDDDDDDDESHALPCYALVVSANHSIMDGHGFYKLYAMLSEDEPIVQLNPVRNTEVPKRMVAAMGGEKSLMQATPIGFLARFLFGTVRNAIYKETKATGFLVNKEFVSSQKKAAALSGRVSFVSTNDVVVSTFCNALRCDVALMAVNFRGRVDGCGQRDVGNYEDLVAYTPMDYSSPSLVRESVGGKVFKRKGGGELPTNWQHLGATYGAITNWATFAKELKVDGGLQDLHLPLFDWQKTTPASVCGAMVVFKPREGEVGVLCAGSEEVVERIKQSAMVGGTLGVEVN